MGAAHFDGGVCSLTQSVIVLHGVKEEKSLVVPSGAVTGIWPIPLLR